MFCSWLNDTVPKSIEIKDIRSIEMIFDKIKRIDRNQTELCLCEKHENSIDESPVRTGGRQLSTMSIEIEFHPGSFRPNVVDPSEIEEKFPRV